MNSKNLSVLIFFIFFICGTYSQRFNLDDSKNISIKALTTYNKWRNQNKRNYLNDDEHLFRQLVFLENLKKIEDHNSDSQNTYKVGANQFSDMTQEEFESRILNFKINVDDFNNLESQNSISYAKQTIPLAASIDWRAKGAVSAVKTQGKCGACWAFSTTGLMESYNFIQNGKLETFSEQQLLDCAIPKNGFYAFGCDGGNAQTALEYIQKFGAVTASTYPYVGIQGTCKVTNPTTGYKPKSFVRVSQDPQALKAALNKAPVSVAVDASLWKSFTTGVFNGCPEIVSLNHSVLAVGYDVSGNWIVKNTWGTGWGESGYIKLAPGNTCGITNVSFAITG